MINVFYNTPARRKLQILTDPKPGSWVNAEAPTEQELEFLADKLKLDIDLLIDGIDPNESPRMERDGTTTYIYTRYCLPAEEKQTTSPLLIVLNSDYVVTVSGRPFNDIKGILKTEVTTNQRAQLVLELMSEINNGYKKRINRVSRRVWEIRSQLDKAHIDNKDFITFIDIEEDLGDFLLALEPMNTTLNTLLNGRFFRILEEEREEFEDIELMTEELIGLANSRLRTIQNIREAYSTMTANNLNRVFKLMTSITILISVFMVITGIYSMNIPLPLAHESYVFWVISGVSFVVIGSLTFFFWRKKWL
jgi:magnesium transporter